MTEDRLTVLWQWRMPPVSFGFLTSPASGKAEKTCLGEGSKLHGRW